MHKVYQHETGNMELDFLHFLHDIIALLLTLNPGFDKDVPVYDTFQSLTDRHFPQEKKVNNDSVSKRPAKPCRVCYACGLRTAKGGT